jgi:hypothetical protein
MATTSTTTTTPTFSAIHHCVTLIQWLDPTEGLEGRRSLCAVRYRDAAIYRRLESVPVDEVGVVVLVGVLIQQLTIPQKKHTPDPTAHKRLKETHDPCASLVPVGEPLDQGL